jgi:ribosomal protein S18 acetylase RimI-like enzyme
MLRNPELVAVDDSNFDSFPCCGIKNPVHPGKLQKRCWLRENAACGLRAQALLDPGGVPVGYLETVPGEFAWRGVDAKGYLFIHCIWIHKRDAQSKGWGSFMLNACLKDAKRERARGVAVLVREGPWTAGDRLFGKNGFVPVAAAPPDYRLLIRKLDPAAPDPTIRPTPGLARYGKGLTIVRTAQCPYTAKFSTEIAETAATECGLTPAIIDLRTPAEAQQAPTPYATFSIVHNGRLLADHQISRTRFRNLMRLHFVED